MQCIQEWKIIFSQLQNTFLSKGHIDFIVISLFNFNDQDISNMNSLILPDILKQGVHVK